MDPKLKMILRNGLVEEPDMRNPFLDVLRESFPDSEDRNRVEMGLKDPSTTLDDLDAIESGDHAQYYRKHNIKEGINPKEISALDGPQNSSNLKMVQSNQSLAEHLITNDGILIDEDLTLKIDPTRMMAFARNGESYFGQIPTNKSQSRIQNALLVFKSKTSKRTQDKILNAILNAADDIIGKEKELISMEDFVNAFNGALDDDEKVRVASELYKIAMSTLYNKA